MLKINSIYYWFYGKYLELLLWLDKKYPKNTFSSTNLTQIIISSQQLKYTRGMELVKNKINSLVSFKNKKEYERVLKGVEDLVVLAEDNAERGKMLESLKLTMDLSSKDIKTDLDKAKMIEKRIEDYRKLQNFKVKKELLKRIRKAKQENDLELVQQLELEWKLTYGRKNS